MSPFFLYMFIVFRGFNFWGYGFFFGFAKPWLSFFKSKFLVYNRRSVLFMFFSRKMPRSDFDAATKQYFWCSVSFIVLFFAFVYSWLFLSFDYSKNLTEYFTVFSLYSLLLSVLWVLVVVVLVVFT